MFFGIIRQKYNYLNRYKKLFLKNNKSLAVSAFLLPWHMPQLLSPRRCRVLQVSAYARLKAMPVALKGVGLSCFVVGSSFTHA